MKDKNKFQPEDESENPTLWPGDGCRYAGEQDKKTTKQGPFEIVEETIIPLVR